MSRRVKPHQVRGREVEEIREEDRDGRILYHHRTVDTLGKMLRDGTIDQAMHDAAKDFQASFIVAQLDPRARCRAAGSGHRARAGPGTSVSYASGAACTTRWRQWAASRARRGLAFGMFVGPSAAFVSGRFGKAGVGDRCARSRRGAS
jgi:hypothetical protein